MLYVNANRDSFRANKPDMSITDVVKELSSMWNALGEKEKDFWNKKAEKAKAKQQKELEKYLKTDVAKAYESEKKAHMEKAKQLEKAIMDADKPKKPSTKSASAK